MKARLITLLLGLLLSSILIPTEIKAQDIEFKKSNFKERKKEFKQAKRNLEKGLKYYDTDQPDYTTALSYLLKAQEFNPQSAELNMDIGICYLNLLEASKAVYHLGRTLELKAKQKPDFYYSLARAYHLNSQFDAAINNYNLYLSLLPKKRFKAETGSIERFISEANYGLQVQQLPASGFSIEPLPGQINSMQADFLPLISNIDLFWCFTSNRHDASEKRRKAEGFETVYFVRKGLNGNLELNRAGNKVNGKGNHSMAVYLSPDGMNLFIRKGDNSGQIQCLKMSKKGKWKKGNMLPKKIMKHGAITSMSISSDQQWMAFTAQAGEKKGNNQLYFSHMGKRKWEKPVLADFNSSMEEMGASFSADGQRLYFASNGLLGLGGYDLFYCDRTDSGWSAPIHAGMPLNTPFDELSITFDPQSSRAILCSNRQGGVGSFDLYEVSMYDPQYYEIAPQAVYEEAVVEIVQEAAPVEEFNREESIIGNPATVVETTQEQGLNLWLVKQGDDYVMKYRISSMEESVQTEWAEGSTCYGMVFNNEKVSDLLNVGIPATSTIDLNSLGSMFTQNSAGNSIWLKGLEFTPQSADLAIDPQAILLLAKAFSDEFPEAQYQLLVSLPTDSLQPGQQALVDARAQKIGELFYTAGISPDRLSFRGQLSSNNEGLIRPAERVELIIVGRF